VRIVLAALLLAACGRSEHPLDTVRQTIDEARPKPRVQIQIRLEGIDPSPVDLQLQRTIEDRIEREHIGRVASSGSTPGAMNITVEVDETVNSIDKIRRLLREAGVLNRSSVKIAETVSLPSCTPQRSASKRPDPPRLCGQPA